MTYKLTFLKSALKEWDKLSSPIKEQFKKKIVKCLENPRIKSAVLSGMKDCLKSSFVLLDIGWSTEFLITAL